MKIIKRILIAVAGLIVLSLFGGYFYFEKKFTPKINNLTVENSSGYIPIFWERSQDSDMSALLLPVKIKGVNIPLYMQLDCGSPNTIFYSRAMESLMLNFPASIQPADSLHHISLSYTLGNLIISSNQFAMIEYGQAINADTPDSIHIIGTIGTDLMEKRITILDFKNNNCAFTTAMPDGIEEAELQQFTFKKRRIMLPGKIDQEEMSFLFDTGTSAYSLITSQNLFEKYSTKNGNEVLSTGNSWGNTLTVHTKESNKVIDFGSTITPIANVTFIEGTSFLQNLLMRFSEMDGMIGNKLFKDKVVVLNCAHEKFAIIE
ncbi:hypothetical protein [Chryseotalea sanaruensis]|nr:hypothetical protein [Chryseotalea sanaruensis]